MSSVGLVLVIVASVVQSALSCPYEPRNQWGAHPPAALPLNLTLPVPFVVIHHTYIPSACNTSATCELAMKKMQYMHQVKNGWNDIGYNFGIGGDGQVYEGRGWDVVGAHAPKYNFMSIGICFIGDYRTELPSADMLQAARSLIQCGVDRGSILANYTLVGHRQVRHTECPGGALFQEIQTWPHWEPIKDIQPRVPAHVETTTSTTTTTTTPPSEDVAGSTDNVVSDNTAATTNEDTVLSGSADVVPDITATTTNNITEDPLSSNGDNVSSNQTA